MVRTCSFALYTSLKAWQIQTIVVSLELTQATNINQLNITIMVAINIELGENLLDRYEVVDFIESKGIKVEYSSLIRFYKRLSAKDRIGMFVRDTPLLEETLLKCMKAFDIDFIDILFKETEQGIRFYNPSFEGERFGFDRDNFCTFFYTD